LQHGFQGKDEGEADWKVAFTHELKKVGRDEKGKENKIKWWNTNRRSEEKRERKVYQNRKNVSE